MDELKSVDRPHHAWLAPIAGYACLIILGFLTNQMTNSDTSRTMLLIYGLMPSLGFLAFHVYGYIKSTQCLIGKRNTKHGIAGLIVNTLSILFYVLLVITLLAALAAAREAAMQMNTNP